MSVSVNISARHLQEPDFAQRLARAAGPPPRPAGAALELEVLETAAHGRHRATSALLERCRALGVRFALDDFGTGYSTLTYLKRLPVDVLKIDRCFVHHMLDDAQDRAIVEGVIGLARTFGCVVVAEGVEIAGPGAHAAGAGLRHRPGHRHRRADAGRRWWRPGCATTSGLFALARGARRAPASRAAGS